MADSWLTFPCPCCDKMIEVDPRSGKARAVRATESKGGTDLDRLLAAQRREQQRLGELFSSAAKDQQHEQERLAAQLERAKQEAKRDPDQPLRRPFDLD